MVKKCKCCGKIFTPKRPRSVCCSISCGKSYASQKRGGIADKYIHPPLKTRMARIKEDEAFMRRARLAKRDLDFRDSPYAPPVTVEERGGRVIETRGRCSCSHVQRNILGA